MQNFESVAVSFMREDKDMERFPQQSPDLCKALSALKSLKAAEPQWMLSSERSQQVRFRICELSTYRAGYLLPQSNSS